MLATLSKSLGSLRPTGAAGAGRGCSALLRRGAAPRFDPRRGGAPQIAAAAMQTQAPPAQRPVVRVPLKDVVEAAVDRWFEEALYEAQRGDVKQAALLAQMFKEGYGTPRDAKAAAKWEERSRARGYRMKGVYCELD